MQTHTHTCARAYTHAWMHAHLYKYTHLQRNPFKTVWHLREFLIKEAAVWFDSIKSKRCDCMFLLRIYNSAQCGFEGGGWGKGYFEVSNDRVWKFVFSCFQDNFIVSVHVWNSLIGRFLDYCLYCQYGTTEVWHSGPKTLLAVSKCDASKWLNIWVFLWFPLNLFGFERDLKSHM